MPVLKLHCLRSTRFSCTRVACLPSREQAGREDLVYPACMQRLKGLELVNFKEQASMILICRIGGAFEQSRWLVAPVSQLHWLAGPAYSSTEAADQKPECYARTRHPHRNEHRHDENGHGIGCGRTAVAAAIAPLAANSCKGYY